MAPYETCKVEEQSLCMLARKGPQVVHPRLYARTVAGAMPAQYAKVMRPAPLVAVSRNCHAGSKLKELQQMKEATGERDSARSRTDQRPWSAREPVRQTDIAAESSENIDYGTKNALDRNIESVKHDQSPYAPRSSAPWPLVCGSLERRYAHVLYHRCATDLTLTSSS